MSASLKVEIDPDLKSVAAKLKALDAQSGGRLRKDLAKAMRGIGDKVVKAEQAAILGTSIKGVKQGGGIRNLRGRRGRSGGGKGIRRPVANSIMRRNRLTGKEVGVEVRTSQGKMPAGMGKIPVATNRGTIRHPVFGDRKNWAEQVVTPAGWWDTTRAELIKPITDEVAAVTRAFEREIEKAMQG